MKLVIDAAEYNAATDRISSALQTLRDEMVREICNNQFNKAAYWLVFLGASKTAVFNYKT